MVNSCIREVNITEINLRRNCMQEGWRHAPASSEDELKAIKNTKRTNNYGRNKEDGRLHVHLPFLHSPGASRGSGCLGSVSRLLVPWCPGPPSPRCPPSHCHPQRLRLAGRQSSLWLPAAPSCLLHGTGRQGRWETEPIISSFYSHSQPY